MGLEAKIGRGWAEDTASDEDARRPPDPVGWQFQATGARQKTKKKKKKKKKKKRRKKKTKKKKRKKKKRKKKGGKKRKKKKKKKKKRERRRRKEEEEEQEEEEGERKKERKKEEEEEGISLFILFLLHYSCSSCFCFFACLFVCFEISKHQPRQQFQNIPVTVRCKCNNNSSNTDKHCEQHDSSNTDKHCEQHDSSNTDKHCEQHDSRNTDKHCERQNRSNTEKHCERHDSRNTFFLNTEKHSATTTPTLQQDVAEMKLMITIITGNF